MELTWKDIEDKLEQMDFQITSRDTNGELYQIEITKSLPYNSHEMLFTLQCDKDNPESVVDAFQKLYDGYDVDYETSLWIGEDGHGKNGAPYHIKTILSNMEQIEDDLEKSMLEMDNYIQNHEHKYTKEEIGELFLHVFHGRFGDNFMDGNVLYQTKTAMNEVLEIGSGTIQHKKDVLSEYFKSIGITGFDENSDNKLICDTYSKAFKKALKERKMNQLKVQNLNTLDFDMSEEEQKIHKMFDTLFNESETNPVDYASFVLSAGSGATLNGLKGDKWWKEACNHAANSGGELWQSSYERVELFEKFGLIEESPAEKKLLKDCYAKYLSYMKINGTLGDEVGFTEFKESIYTNKTEMTEFLQGNEKLLEAYRNKEDLKDSKYEKLCETSDKKYGEYLFKYLKSLNVLDDKKRDQLIKKHEERNIGKEGR